MKLLALDTESCDGSCIDGSLCSVGYTLFDEQFNILEQNDVLVNPLPKEFRLSAYGKAAEIELGYPVSVFRAAPRFSGVYETVAKLFGEDVLVLGFSFVNDIGYLNDACDKFGLKRFSFKYLDVQTLYSLYKKEKRQIGLSTAAEEFNITFSEHRSDEDARATGLVLKGIAQSLNTDINGLIEKYELIYGENGLEPKLMTSAIYEREKFDKSVKSVKKILIDEFRYALGSPQKKVPFRYSGKSVCFSEDIEYGDPDYFRSLIGALNVRNSLTVRDVGECNIFVKGVDEYGVRYFKARQRVDTGERISIISFEKFIAEIGPFELLKFKNDELTLKKYYERKAVKKKERAELKKSLVKDSVSRMTSQKAKNNEAVKAQYN